MSIVPAKLRCDQCGTVIAYKQADGWMRISASTEPGLGIFGAGRTVADLCSWPCLSDYAIAQALDRA